LDAWKGFGVAVEPQTMKKKGASKARSGFLKEHALSLTSIGILLAWVALYFIADPQKHWGSFFGNAIADWTGVVVTVIATKYFYEVGSAESKQPPPKIFPGRIAKIFRDHSLTIFLAVTGLAWVVLYACMDSESKWGQVVGNIVSEWTQLFGLVLLTKKLIERSSKESRR
jgi:hypothetical protein